MTAMPKLHITVEDEVKTGGIGYLLCRPVNYILYRYAEFAGEFAVRLVVNLLVGGALGLALLASRASDGVGSALCRWLPRR